MNGKEWLNQETVGALVADLKEIYYVRESDPLATALRPPARPQDPIGPCLLKQEEDLHWLHFRGGRDGIRDARPGRERREALPSCWLPRARQRRREVPADQVRHAR